MTNLPDLPEQFNVFPRRAEFWDSFSKSVRYAAPKDQRFGEVRGGGYIVIERTRTKRLLRAAMWPVESESLKDAVAAAERLRKRYPRKIFCVFHLVATSEPDEA